VVACVSPLNPPILGDLGALTRVLTTTFAKGNDQHQWRGERRLRVSPVVEAAGRARQSLMQMFFGSA
jgi:hypothetical protein